MKYCQALIWRTGEKCPAAATWTVQVGTRRLDAQDSCERHLSHTCWVMLQNEDRPLTVTRVSQS